MRRNTQRQRVLGRILRGRRPSPAEPSPATYEEQLFAALVRPGDVCFDVGAYDGAVATQLVRLAGESGTVVAFEPVWPLYVRLCDRLRRDRAGREGRVVPVAIGLADTERVGQINVPDGNFGMGSMADADAWSDAQRGAELAKFTAHFTTLDAFLAGSGLPPPTFLKIDVEGAELAVFHGAVDFFAEGQRPLMLVEIFAPWEEAFGYGPWDVLSWLGERGYRFLFACPNGLVDHDPTPETPFPPDYDLGYNVVVYLPAAHANQIAAAGHMRADRLSGTLQMEPPPRPNRVGEARR